jgi:hypothetical protein
VSDNIVVGFEDAVGEPEVLNRVELRRLRRQWQDRDVGGHDKVVRHVPSRLVHDEDDMRVIDHVSGDFCQVLGHGVGITPGHDQRRRFTELWADGSEDIGRAGSLVMRGGWP